MVSLKKSSKGFTIVELLIVIVVIGILATLVIVTFTGIQQKARDSKRQTDITAVVSHLAAYYASNGYYPTVIDLQSSAFVTANFKGLDPAALVDPKGGTITGAAPVAGTYKYSYVPVGCDNTAASSATNQCTNFTLTSQLESGSTFVKASNT